MKKAVVTGANSFIGYRLCKVLEEHGYFVYAIIRRDNQNNFHLCSLKNIAVIYEEMKDYKNISSIIGDCCDVGVALAWDGTRGDAREDAEKQRNNYVYSMECVKSFIQAGCSVVVTAGSQAEYGSWYSNGQLSEEVLCRPNTEYGKYKLKLYEEAVSVCEESHVRLIEPRFFSLYGPDDYEGTMIISILSDMLHDRVCKLTQCIQQWDFLYVEDAVDALFRLIDSKSSCGVYNFGYGRARELKEYVMLMYELTKSHSLLEFGAIPYPSTGMVNTNPSIEKLCKEISWKPQISFEEGIMRVIDKMRKTEQKYEKDQYCRSLF